jgi:hypothetical protein
MKILATIGSVLIGICFLFISIVGIYNYHIKSDMFINEPMLLILFILLFLTSVFWIVYSLFPKTMNKWLWGGDDRKFF